MRFETLDLVRYGHFDDRKLEFRKSGKPEKQCDLQLVYGPNEAGKSTIREAISDLLFRVPARSKMNFASKTMLRVGARVEIAGKPIELYRLKKNKDDLVDAEDRAVSPDPLAGVIAGFDRERFEQSFSVSREQLEAGGNAIVKGKGDLGALLFAGVSGMQDVPKKLAALDTRATEIWRAKGGSAAGDLIARIRQIDHDVRQLQTTQSAYDTKRREVDRLNRAFEEAKHSYTTVSADIANVTARIVAFRPYRDRLRELNALEEIGEGPTATAEDRERVETVIRELAAFETRLEDARVKKTGLEARLQEIPHADPISEHREAIEDLVETSATIRAQRRDVPAREAEAMEASQRIARVLSDLDLEDIADAADLALPAKVSSRLADLLSRQAELRSALRTAKDEVESAADALSEAQTQLDGMGDPVDPEPLRAALKAAGRRDLVSEHLQIAAEIARIGTQIDKLVAPFGLDRDEADRLRDLDLPARSDVDALEAEIAHAAAEVIRLTSTLDQRREAVAGAEDALKSLGDISALSDKVLQSAVGARDELVASIRGSIAADKAEILRAGIEEAVVKTDRIFTERVREAARLGELSIAERNRAREMSAAARAQEELNDAIAKADDLARKVASLIPAGITASGIEGLRHLMVAREEIRSLLIDLAEGNWRAAEVTAAGEEQAAGIAAMLSQMGTPPAADARLQVLLNLAASRLEDLDEALRTRASARKRRDEAEQNLKRRRERIAKIEAETADWDKAFRDTLLQTWIPATSEPAQVSAILNRLPELTEARANLQTANHRLVRMRQDTQAAQAKVAAFLETANLTATHADDHDTDFVMIVDRLSARLGEARRRDNAETEFQEAIRELEEQIEGFTSDVGQTRAKVADLVKKFGKTEFSELRSVIETGVKRQAHLSALAGFERDMMEALSFTSVDEALEKLDDSDEENLKARLTDLEADRRKAIDARDEASQAAAIAANELLAMSGSDRIARLLQERETLKADLIEFAQAYMVLRAGEKALNWALTRYRQANKAPMLKAASRFFARMTDDRYPELITQPGNNGDELVARKESGGVKEVQEMSEGTAHQLFLALRMAGYLEIARGRPAPPLILDDILSSSDEERTGAILLALADLAEEAQVIVLTHHAHVLEIADRAIGGRHAVVQLNAA
ncbi:AAA family ATPase [Thalassobaculum litoreum]|uniref:Uncharacterized protein YhaN n=1 Tax=Thalassobaculum litoreum DSM 18839 TaxID=1123362 RepID=A0A8G2BKB0_9PROT|nr:AAA family ATPase [Thalassobaculum litoreum]SDG17865.1 Uncharacterized protein YhaN [Thalassobaculum litoreum DSM 18839]